MTLFLSELHRRLLLDQILPPSISVPSAFQINVGPHNDHTSLISVYFLHDLTTNMKAQTSSEQPLSENEYSEDGEAYAYLLNVLAPEHCSPGTLDTKDPTERANLVLEHTKKMDCKRYLAPKDIVEGSANLNLAFVAHTVQDSLGR
ncbi:unnamed protein product [Lactuca virosa]|uniref:Calponin-homology (CH) domain-containing protein n=1 Tax=Lactuca virosa TaxID=75947 RepID=A0AAU9PBQ0_9ASTR|nr:unnamed protein product [Lactuca virosa]